MVGNKGEWGSLVNQREEERQKPSDCVGSSKFPIRVNVDEHLIQIQVSQVFFRQKRNLLGFLLEVHKIKGEDELGISIRKRR